MDPRGDGFYILWIFLTKEERDYFIDWFRFMAARHQEKIERKPTDPPVGQNAGTATA
jgi:hypothetical protein